LTQWVGDVIMILEMERGIYELELARELLEVFAFILLCLFLFLAGENCYFWRCQARKDKCERSGAPAGLRKILHIMIGQSDRLWDSHDEKCCWWRCCERDGRRIYLKWEEMARTLRYWRWSLLCSVRGWKVRRMSKLDVIDV
jgi:hypothetical protein